VVNAVAVAAAAGAVTARRIKACSAAASHVMLLAGFTVAVQPVHGRHLRAPAWPTPLRRHRRPAGKVHAGTTPWVIGDDAL